MTTDYADNTDKENPRQRSSVKSKVIRVAVLGCFWPLAFISNSLAAHTVGQLRQVGVARIDITPAYAIRLTGYAVRKSESEGVAERLWAKALAIGSDRERPALLI